MQELNFWLSGIGHLHLDEILANGSLFSGQLPFESVVSRKSGCSTSSPALDSKMMRVCKRRICISPATREGADFLSCELPLELDGSYPLSIFLLCYLPFLINLKELLIPDINLFFPVIFVENTFDQSVACLFTLENLLLYRSLQLSCS